MSMKEEGFNYLEEKGLFTFYKEQEESSKQENMSPYRINLRRQRANDSQNKSKDGFGENNHYQNQAFNTFVSLDSKKVVINTKKETNTRSPFKLTNPKGNQSVNQSSKRMEMKTKTMSARRQVFKQAQYILKGRAKTEASQVQIKPAPSAHKLWTKVQGRAYSRFQNNYFSEKIEKHSPKKSSIFFKLRKDDTLSKIKVSNKNIKPFTTFITPQVSQVINENLIVKGIQDKEYQGKKLSIEVRKAELLPQLKPGKGSSIDFWEYFQQRKLFFINRYKKAKANKMREVIAKQKKHKNYN